MNHLLRALDTFRVLGIEFASLSESLDTATPAGRIRLYRVGRGGRTGAQFNRIPAALSTKPPRFSSPLALQTQPISGNGVGVPKTDVVENMENKPAA